MWLKSRLLFLLAPLLFVTAVQAAPNDPPASGEGRVASTPAPKLHASSVSLQPGKSASVKGTKRSRSRYGIGYEARHGIDAGIPDDRGNQMERPERPERMERIERDGRGR